MRSTALPLSGSADVRDLWRGVDGAREFVSRSSVPRLLSERTIERRVAQSSRRRSRPVGKVVIVSNISMAEAKKEVERLVTGKFIAMKSTQYAFVNHLRQAEMKTDEAEIYIEGGYWFRGSTISECVAKVKEWKS